MTILVTAQKYNELQAQVAQLREVVLAIIGISEAARFESNVTAGMMVNAAYKGIADTTDDGWLIRHDAKKDADITRLRETLVNLCSAADAMRKNWDDWPLQEDFERDWDILVHTITEAQATLSDTADNCVISVELERE